MDVGGNVLLIGCVLLIACVLLAHLLEHAGDFLRKLTVNLALIVVVVILIIQMTPLQFGTLEERLGKLVRPVAAAVQTPNRR